MRNRSPLESAAYDFRELLFPIGLAHLRPGRSVCDPIGKVLDFFGRKVAPAWHLEFASLEYRLDKQAVAGLAGGNRRSPVATAEECFSRVDTQS